MPFACMKHDHQHIADKSRAMDGPMTDTPKGQSASRLSGTATNINSNKVTPSAHDAQRKVRNAGFTARPPEF